MAAVANLVGATLRTPALAATALLTLLTGCTSSEPWLVKRDAPTAGPVVTKPSERMESLERVAKDVRKATPEQRAQVAKQLSQALPAEPDPLIRIEMVRTLGEFPPDLAQAALVGSLEDGDEDVRMAACEAMARQVSSYLKESRWTSAPAEANPHAEAAITALGKIVADDADIDVRLAATRALGGLGVLSPNSEKYRRSTIAALAPALEQSDPSLQFRAMESLKKVADRDFGNDVAAWREFAQGREPQRSSDSLASRVRNWFN